MSSPCPVDLFEFSMICEHVGVQIMSLFGPLLYFYFTLYLMASIPSISQSIVIVIFRLTAF